MVKEVKGSDRKVMDMLLENSIALQHNLADLAADLKTLNERTTSLLGLFESASKTIKERPKGVSTDVLDKIDALAKQNKTIAKGLLLLERAIREKEPSSRSLPEI